ncbi:MAG: PQQ-dependent sugar dehydrogenase [Pseudomonadota bacterium]
MTKQLSTALGAMALCASTELSAQAFEIEGNEGTRLNAEEIASFGEPWAMTFLPDGTKLVSEKNGTFWHVTQSGEKTAISGVWDVAYGGQGGLGDVIAHRDFADNGLVYVSFAEAGNGGNGAVVNRARLDTSGDQPTLRDVTRIWEQPKVRGAGHYAHKMAFGPDGKLYITSGDRQAQTPAQDLTNNLGTIVRLNDDGTVPPDNPFRDLGGVAESFWTVGHRNPLGIDFTSDGVLWAHEMGPRHGDELNLIVSGENYGWPTVSNGDNYSGIPIPDHETRPEFEAPKAYWVPSIAPSGLVIYEGGLFGKWDGDALIGGLVSQALVHVSIDGETARETERFEWGERIREVEESPDGALYVLEDGGRMLKLTPAG